MPCTPSSPAANHATRTQRKAKDLAAVTGAVELVAVGEPAGVMHLGHVTLLGGFAFALLDDCIAETFGAVFKRKRCGIGEEIHVGDNGVVYFGRDEFHAEDQGRIRRNHGVGRCGCGTPGQSAHTRAAFR